MAAPTSFFLEKLQPEIRLRIYGHVFGQSRVVKPSSSDTAFGMRIDPTDSVAYSTPPPSPETFLDTSILLSNKFVFAEALPVLYGEKIIRGTTDDISELLRNPDFVERVRHLELADCIGSYKNKHFHATLRRLQVLPRLRSLAILSDCLGYVDKKLAGTAEFMTVPQFCDIAQLGEVTCIDIGRYQLHGMFGNFQFVNRRLSQMFPSVQGSPKDYDVYQDLETIWDGRPALGKDPTANHNTIAWASQTSLCRWVGLHDLLISMKMSGEIDCFRSSHEPAEAEMFLTLKRYSRTTRPYGHFDAKQLVDGFSEQNSLGRCRLRDSKAGDDPELLSWATEYLSVNVHTYDAPAPSGSRRLTWTHRKSHCAETDGSLSTIEYHFKHMETLKAGMINSLYICHPVRLDNVISREAVSHSIGHFPIPLNGILTGKWRRNYPDLNNLELKQMIYLCKALSVGRVRPASGEPGEHDRWSSNLLQRYILASGSLSQADVHHAPVDDLRKVVKTILSALSSSGKRGKCGLTDASLMVRTQPPEDFDSDLSSHSHGCTVRCLSAPGVDTWRPRVPARWIFRHCEPVSTVKPAGAGTEMHGLQLGGKYSGCHRMPSLKRQTLL